MSSLKLSLSVALAMFLGSTTLAADFPYDAVISVDKTMARSGPGSMFYETSLLSSGTKVAVHRHDPGGWYMIAPPADSFSWVRSDYVTKITPDQGTLTENNVVVRVGSTVGEYLDVEQRRLNKGDRVTIIGEKQFDLNGRPVHFYKISPPTGEFRWIKGDAISSGVAASTSLAPSSDPFAQEVTQTKSNGIELGNPFEEPTGTVNAQTPSKAEPDEAPLSTAPATKQQQDYQILSLLDEQFRVMISKDVSTWSLDDLAHDYEKLQKEASSEALVHQIDLRLAAVERYRKTKRAHDEFVNLTAQTTRRDAQLLNSQTSSSIQSTGGSFPDGAAFGSATTGGQFPEISADGSVIPPLPTGNQATQKMPSGLELSSGNPTAMSVGNDPTEPPANGLAGAGIVQLNPKQHPQLPAFILTSPDGRFLTYLHPQQGVNLMAAVGQPRGIQGNRLRDQRLNADVIVVESVHPVQLSPAGVQGR